MENIIHKKHQIQKFNFQDIVLLGKVNQIVNRYTADGRNLGTEYFTMLIPITLRINKNTTWTYSSGLVNQIGTVYIDNKEYNTFNGYSKLTKLQRVYNTEGFADTITATIPNYKYYRRDHLGNNREVWCANSNTTLQYTQYYPSGLPWAFNVGDNPGLQERKYNGKEFVEMHGLDTYDYGARGYYPALGRFTSVDPLAEKYYSISPYAYCAGNPVNSVDPNGKDYIITIQRDKNNEITGITFSATIFIQGEGASKDRASELNGLAKETFKSKESNGVKIGFDVNYVYDPNITIGDVGKDGKNLLTFTNDKVDNSDMGNRKDSNVKTEIEGDAYYHGDIYNSKGKSSSNYDVMHETMHFFGFNDRYNARTGMSDVGYKNDIMGKEGKYDLSPNHYSNMYEFSIKQPAIQQDRYLKQIYNWLPQSSYKNNFTKSIVGDKMIDNK